MATETDGARAHDILLSFEPLGGRGLCWRYVWQAYKEAGASTDAGSTPTAFRGWEVSHGKHPGDRNPPFGAAVWLGRRGSDGDMKGDVFIAGRFDGDHAATDEPTWLQTGVTSIAARMQLTGREYLGWTDHVIDCPIRFPGLGPAPVPVTPNQRTTGPNGANQRPAPTTASPIVDFLDPGVVGTFDGWTHGENVQGNDVWFRGAFSGWWSWSGGFTDAGVHDLPAL